MKLNSIVSSIAVVLLVMLSLFQPAAAVLSSDGNEIDDSSGFVGSLPLQNDAAIAGALTGLKVAYANIHGERQTESLDAMKALLAQYGATVTTITSVSQISNMNILWIDESGTDYTASEISSIKTWLAAGSETKPRGILFHGDGVGATNLMNAVGAAYANQNGHAGATTNILPQVKTIVKKANFAAPMNSISGMAWVVKDINNDHTMVGVNTEAGRSALISDDILWYTTGEPNLTMDDNSKLALVIFGWLGWKV